MNIVYASSFKNEQVASGGPVRMVVTGPAQGASQKVDGNGYLFQPNILNGNQYTLDPGASFTGLRYRCYSVSWTPLSSAVAVLNSLISVFGFSLPAEYKKDQVVRKLVVLQDTQTQTSRCYVNGRYVSDGTVQGTITVTGASGSAVYPTYYITDLVIGESDTEEKFSASLVDQVLTEVANEWEFNGATLIESLDKTNTTTVEPSASVYYEGKTFTVAPEDTDKPLLVEGVGSAAIDPHSYELLVNSDSVELTPSPTLVDLILPPADTITVGRRNIITPPTYPMPNTLALKLDDRDGVYRDLVTKSAMTNVSGTPTTNLTNSKDGQYSTTFTSGFLSKAITPIGTQDYTIEVWAYVPFSTAQQVLVVSSTGPSSSGYVASNLMFVVYVGASGQSFVTYSGSSTGAQAAFTPPLSEGAVDAWHHICMQRSGGIVYGYFNGQRSADSYPQNFNCTGTTLYVGCYSDGGANRRFTGKLSYYGLNVGSTRYPIEGFTPEYPPYRIPE